MIAAMEVESHCKAVLRANGVSLTNSNTEDYVKLLTAMKLDDYEIALSRYPDLDLIRPFAGWDPARPTQSLAFYAAYNSVKHDRETAFDRGTLKLALEAVAACAVLATAQFGWASIFGSNRGLEEFFTLTSVPRWRLSETYMMETHGWLAREVHYKF